MNVTYLVDRIYRAKEILGADTLVSELVDFLSKDDAVEFLDSLERNYEITTEE